MAIDCKNDSETDCGVVTRLHGIHAKRSRADPKIPADDRCPGAHRCGVQAAGANKLGHLASFYTSRRRSASAGPASLKLEHPDLIRELAWTMFINVVTHVHGTV